MVTRVRVIARLAQRQFPADRQLGDRRGQQAREDARARERGEPLHQVRNHLQQKGVGEILRRLLECLGSFSALMTDSYPRPETRIETG